MNPNENNDTEISLLDIGNFLQGAWKKLVIASIVGAVLGLSSWFFLGSYSAEYVLLINNNNNNNNTTNSYALNLVSWKILQKSLPNLAAQALVGNKAPENQASLFSAMSNEQWWQKNVIASYALSKADTKDLAGISKDLDAVSTTILNLTLTASASSKEQALDNVRTASKFLRSGGAYVQLRSLLNGYASQTISTVAELQQEITRTQIELGYQIERTKGLEELRKRFSGGASTNISQQFNVDDSGGKYLPLTTQIIAANSDINQSKETLLRLGKRLDQMAIVKAFMEKATPLQEQAFDGLALDDQLLGIQADLRSKVAKDDSNSQEILDQLRTQLLAVQVRFSKGLEANAPPTASGKKGLIKSTAGGLAGAFFLMLLVLLGQRVWASVKSGGAK